MSSQWSWRQSNWKNDSIYSKTERAFNQCLDLIGLLLKHLKLQVWRHPQILSCFGRFGHGQFEHGQCERLKVDVSINLLGA